jgi:hypothetical protein
MKQIVYILSVFVLIAVCGSCSKKEPDLFSSLYGVVTDAETNSPLSGATVTLAPGGKTQMTGSDGRYEFLSLEAMQYTLTVQKAGYSTNRKTVSAVSGQPTETNITLTANP